MDKNFFLPFHVFTCVFENKWLFIQKTMRVFFEKFNKKLDSRNSALKRFFNQITLKFTLISRVMNQIKQKNLED